MNPLEYPKYTRPEHLDSSLFVKWVTEKWKIWEDKLKKQIQDEYNLALKTVQIKRMKFRDQDRLYMSIINNNDKLDLHTVYYLVRTQLAMMMVDDLAVEFSYRRKWWKDKANNVKNVALYDSWEMELEVLRYYTQLDRLLRWVWLVIQTWFDVDRKVPIFKHIPTLNWIPDPSGWLDHKSWRFEWFETTNSRFNLECAWVYKNLDLLKDWKNTELQLTDLRQKQNASLSPTTDSLVWDNQELYIYHHFTRFEWKPYYVVLWNNRDLILRIEEIPAITESEKKNSSLIQFPIVHYYFNPKPGDPYGISLVDLVQTQHMYKNLLMNFAYLKEKDVAIWNDVIYDLNVMPNKDHLAKPSVTWKKFIWVDWTKALNWLSWVVHEMPKTWTQGSVYEFANMLDKNTEYTTATDARQMWIQGWSAITLWESQQLQANNNLNQALFLKINNIWEQKFWKLWLRSYKENLSAVEKKFITIAWHYDTKELELYREDFCDEEDPDIRIISKSQAMAEKSQLLAKNWPALVMIYNNPNASKYERMNAMRKLLEWWWIDRQEMDAELVTPVAEEIDARQRLILLNAWNPLWLQIQDYNVDHNIYISIFSECTNERMKRLAIQARMLALLWSEMNLQWNPNAQASQSLNNNVNSQMMNKSAISDANSSNILSRSNIQA